MNDIDHKLHEQLCAWMDGELPAAEARFFERRLAHDPDLRGKWERLQLASACLRGQAWRPMPATLAQGVASTLADAAPAMRRRPWALWATAASVAVLALALFPRPALQPALAPAAPVLARLPVNPVPSPASADLVAPAAVAASAPLAGAPVASAVAPMAAAEATADPIAAALAMNPPAPGSPLPLATAVSPADFPLVETASAKSWPRSPLATATAGDPALEAYLVRHNQMATDAALGGFVPYVDVVTSDPSETGDSGVAAGARR